ncbi:polymerase epsilon subunit 3 [Seminavis robusta]|uniref:Polymerase epsilon subunit 3 n=1 Tax=Seminavis robusta TaxID=568900 RepID=A0A9N8DN99_9STRA|nr:polymerase epsilon subunit 3 [Seminavis robusta]|eukprot:Sro256_g100540.1 polymerase epsilon subunit 3 (188) ;mRNA; f:10962-11620
MATTPNNESAAPQNLPTAVEFEPPLACVRRILKTTLPASTNVGKDASAAFARSAGIFIIYLTACANDFARENRRQTITANDVLAACKELDFEEFTPKLEEFLESYRANEKRKKDAKAKAASVKAMDESSKPATPQSTASVNNPPRQEKDDESTEEEVATEEEDNAEEDHTAAAEPPSKKQKMDEGEE